MPETVGLVFSRGYAMVVFPCGRFYRGDDDVVMAAVERHRHSGCKRCRRTLARQQRRLAASLPGVVGSGLIAALR